MKKLTKATEAVYAFSAFGPNLLVLFVNIYLTDALLPEGLVKDRELWSFTGAALVTPLLYSLLTTLAKIADGLVDFPFSVWLQNFTGRHGRHKTALFIGIIPMAASYALIWSPLATGSNAILNSVIVGLLVLVFYISYTLTLLTFYNTFAEITENEKSRVRLSSWKSVFDTVGYSIAYALFPLLLGLLKLNIRTLVFLSMPLFLTLVIPFFIIRDSGEEERPAAPTRAGSRATLGGSIKTALANRDFMNYIYVMMTFQFGLQMFLVAQNVIASGVMLLSAWQIAVINTAAFAPVPVMVLIFNRLQRKRGLRFGFRAALVTFAVAMLVFTSTAFLPGGDEFTMLRMCVGATGSLIGSYAIAVFFAVLYIIPSQIGADELKRTGKNTSSTLFATQGLAVALVTAIGNNLVYTNLKGLDIFGREDFGIVLVAPIVALSCIAAFFLARRLPATYEKK